MPVVSASGYNTVADATALIRALLNDTDVAGGAVFTDTVLVPLVNAAYRKVQRRFAENGITVFTSEIATLTLPANSIQITDSSTPQLPTDLIAPRELWEKPAGSTEKFRSLRQVSPLPDVNVGTFLSWWEWRDGMLNFVGGNRDIVIRLRYEKALSDLAASTDNILIRRAVDPIAYYGAALAAASRGAPEAGTFQALADQALGELLNINIRLPGQSKMRRRKPYRGRPGQVYYW
jgi:hypothetical protein